MKRFLTVLSQAGSHSTQVNGSNQLSRMNGKLLRSVKWLCIVVPIGIVTSLGIVVVAWRDGTITPVALAAPPPISARASRVTIGSPSGQTPENHQNEPAIAMDAHNPDVLVAGVNDFIESPTVSPVHRNPTGKVRGPERRNNPRYRSLWCAESAPRIPERLRSGRRVEVRFASSINLSGQSRFIKSFFSTIPPLFSTSTRSVSKTFAVSGIGCQCTAIPPGRYRP